MYKVTNNSKEAVAIKVRGGGYATLAPKETRTITPPKAYSEERIKELDKAGVKVEAAKKGAK